MIIFKSINLSCAVEYNKSYAVRDGTDSLRKLCQQKLLLFRYMRIFFSLGTFWSYNKEIK